MILFAIALADTTYTVKNGDCLNVIAQKFGTTVKQLQEWNGMVNPDLIYGGQVLIVAKSSSSSSTTPSESSTSGQYVTDAQMKQIG